MSDDDLYKVQAEASRKRESEAIAEAYKYRVLWEAAASCLAHNAGKLKPRGADEAKVIDLAIRADHGKFWSGETSGWLS